MLEGHIDLLSDDQSGVGVSRSVAEPI